MPPRRVLPAGQPEDEEAEHLPHALAIVESYEGSSTLRLRLHLPQASAGSLPDPAQESRFAGMRLGLAAAAGAWWCQKLCNLSTISREWDALHSVAELPFLDVLLKAALPAAQGAGAGAAPGMWEVPQPLMAVLEAKHNASQVEALKAALSPQPVVLIQARGEGSLYWRSPCAAISDRASSLASARLPASDLIALSLVCPHTSPPPRSSSPS